MPLPQSTKKVMTQCPHCHRHVKVPLAKNINIRVTCVCGRQFIFKSNDYFEKQLAKKYFVIFLCLLAANIAVPVSASTVAYFQLSHKTQQELKTLTDQHENERSKLTSEYEQKLSAATPEAMRQAASSFYEEIMAKRKSFDAKYALTDREKSLLELSLLGSQNEEPLTIVHNLARQASPSGAEITVTETSSGIYELGIDFEMSELSRGEKGARTKHDSIGSLKSEVHKLVSQVTNDVFLFSKNINISSIEIGCKHGVRTEYKGEQSIVIYRMRLNRSDVREISGNPFLEEYSTGKYLKVTLDEFPNLRLTTL